MHANILYIVLVGNYVSLSRKSPQSLVVQIHSQGINPGNQDVKSQIKLQPINEVGFADVSLNNTALIGSYILKLFC